jgi:hypothetical protein
MKVAALRGISNLVIEDYKSRQIQFLVNNALGVNALYKKIYNNKIFSRLLLE